MTVKKLQQLSSRSIIRHGIRRRSQTVKSIMSILIRVEFSTQVAVVLLVVLLLVEAVGGRLPDIDGSVADGLLGLRVDDCAVHVRDLAVLGHVLDNRGAVREVWCVVAEEGAENGGCGGCVVGF